MCIRVCLLRPFPGFHTEVVKDNRVATQTARFRGGSRISQIGELKRFLKISSNQTSQGVKWFPGNLTLQNNFISKGVHILATTPGSATGEYNVKIDTVVSNNVVGKRQNGLFVQSKLYCISSKACVNKTSQEEKLTIINNGTN